MKILKYTFLLILVLCVNFSSLNASISEYLPVDKIKPGEKGIGKTVFKGNLVEEFDFEVLSILKEAGPTGGDLIIIRVFGEKIQKNGGISLGMSGSPVYLRNKLIGAISMTFPETDHYIGGVTPIYEMLRYKEHFNFKREMNLKSNLNIKNNNFSKIEYFYPDEVKSKSDGGSVLKAVFAYKPILLLGVSERNKKYLNLFDKSYLSDFAMVGEVKDNDCMLTPGSAIAVQLARGNINIAAVGTVTERIGNDIFAFGHSFLRKGKTNFLMSSAVVHDTIKNRVVPYKLTSVGSICGNFYEDRGTALLGELGKFPSIVHFNIKVKDVDREVENNYNLQIVNDVNLLPQIVGSLTVQAIDNTIDMISGGTAKMSYSISLGNVNKTLVRDDMFYSKNDIAVASVDDFVEFVNIIKDNEFKKVEVNSIKLNVEIESKIKYATIVGLEVKDVYRDTIKNGFVYRNKDNNKAVNCNEDNFFKTESEKMFFQKSEPSAGKPKIVADEDIIEVKKGQILKIDIIIKPYRGDEIRKEVSYFFDNEIEKGYGTLRIGSKEGINKINYKPIDLIDIEGPEKDGGEKGRSKDSSYAGETENKSLDDLLNDISKKEKNNEIITYFIHDNEKERKVNEKRKIERYDTNWVIIGSKDLKVKVID